MATTSKEQLSPTDLWSERVKRMPKLTPEEQERHLDFYYKGIPTPLDKAPAHISRIPWIEVTGSPKTGKTTLIKLTSKLFDELEIPHHIIEERNVPFDKGGNLDSWDRRMYNIMLTMSTVEEMLRLYFDDDRARVPVIIDRGIFNAFAFFDAEATFGRTTHRGTLREEAKTFFSHHFCHYINALIVFTASPQNSISRDTDPGRIMTEEYLDPLEKAFYRLCAASSITKHHKGPLVVVNIDGNEELNNYSELFVQTIGSICDFYNK